MKAWVYKPGTVQLTVCAAQKTRLPLTHTQRCAASPVCQPSESPGGLSWLGQGGVKRDVAHLIEAVLATVGNVHHKHDLPGHGADLALGSVGRRPVQSARHARESIVHVA